ncbi:MAG TPA: ABC transporter permease [Gaiellaceae bacterium]|jgi:spermidine/putrescine transport system permease protein
MAVAAETSTEKRGLPGGFSYRPGKSWLALPTVLFLLAVLIFPLVLIGLYSVNLMTNLVGVPTDFSLFNWKDFLPPGSNPFWDRFVTSIVITVVVSVLAVLAAYPIAYYLAFVARRRRYVLLLLVLAPFFTSYLLRVIAWKVMLANNGVINATLWELGLREHGDGIQWLIFSWFAVALVLFYSWVPFVALPIYVVLENMDTRLLEAAQDLGGGRLHVFRRVTLPLSLPGVIAAFVFVLIPTTGEFIAPLLVGGSENTLFGNSIQSFFSDTPNWNYGAVLAVWLIAVVFVLLLLFGRFLNTDLREARAR